MTTASVEAALALVRDPVQLKARTIGLFRGVWEACYRTDYFAHRAELAAAAAAATPAMGRGFGLAFADLTGNRPPAPLVARLGEIDRVAFCPSAHLGTFVSYILYPPDLIVFFGAPELLARCGRSFPPFHRFLGIGTFAQDAGDEHPAPAAPRMPAAGLSDEALLAALRALADPTRLRIVDLLGENGQLYAQEIVGRLGIAQSAVSRHLGLLERAGLVGVRARRGMKYYAVDTSRVAALTEMLLAKARVDGASSERA